MSNPCLQALGKDGGPFKFYEEWLRQDDMTAKAEIGPEQQDFINTLRRHLDDASDRFMRIVAEPGVGKTQMVLEALKPKRFSTACIYVDKPSLFVGSSAFRRTLKGTKSEVFLVADECDYETMLDMQVEIKDTPLIKLVAIYSEPDPEPFDTVQIYVPRLNDEQIVNILESYGVPRPHLARWCKICKQSPRTAHIVGEHLKHNSSQIDQMDVRCVWDLHIASKTPKDSDEFKMRKKILQRISSFRRIGHRGRYQNEFDILYRALKKHEGITLGDFTKTVRELKEMHILRGDTILHITPDTLHLHLWRGWYAQYHNMESKLPGYRPKKVIEYSPEANMLQWRMDMFRYAKETGFNDHVKTLLSEGSYADKHKLLRSEFGAKLLFSLAKDDIEGAVGYIRRHTLHTYDFRLPKSRNGKRWIAVTLLGAAMKRELFEESARLLLSLAEADVGNHGYFAKVFEYLFMPISGQPSQTEMPPSGRLPLLRDKILSSNTKRCDLIIQTCDAVLSSPRFSASYGQEELWQNCAPWTPKSEKDVSEYDAEVLKILSSCLRYRLSGEADAKKILLKNCIGRLGNPVTSKTAVKIVEDAYKEYGTDPGVILGAILSYVEQWRILPMPKPFLSGACRLLRMLIEGNYPGMMWWAIASRPRYDLNDDPLNIMAELARRSLDDNLLYPELSWLLTGKAVRGYDFGHILGSLGDFNLLLAVLDAQKQSEATASDFLAGYIRSIFESDATKWEGVMYKLCRDPDLRVHVPEMASQSGMTDDVAMYIHDLVRKGVLEPSSLKSFVYSNLVNKLSESTFKKWMVLLQDGDLTSRQTRMHLYCLYYVVNKRVMPSSARDVLLPGDAETVASDPYQVTYWCEILKASTRQYPGDDDTLSAALAFAVGNLAGTGAEDAFFDILSGIADQSRGEAWGYVANLLDSVPHDPVDSDDGKFLFVKYLLDGGTLIDRVSLPVIFRWVGADAGRRAPLVARVLPVRLDIAAETVSKYGGDRRVRDILICAQVQTHMGFFRSRIAEKIKEVESFKAGVTDPAARIWLDECITVLKRRMGRRRPDVAGNER